MSISRVYQDSQLIKAYSDISRHIQAYLAIFRHILNPVSLWDIENSGIFRIMAYSKPQTYSELWYIQNSGTFRTRDIQNARLFRTLGYSEPEAYSEPHQTSMMEHFEKQLTAIIIFAVSAFYVL